MCYRSTTLLSSVAPCRDRGPALLREFKRTWGRFLSADFYSNPDERDSNEHLDQGKSDEYLGVGPV